MKLDEAQKVANEMLEIILPYCHEAVIAGSIRREKPECRDIEIVAIPGNAMYSQDKAKLEIYTVLDAMAKKIKGQPNGKYIQWHLNKQGIKLDLFYATIDNFGLILAIRTGSAEYSHLVLAKGWTKLGYHSAEGVLYDEYNNPVYVRKEEELFTLLGLPWVHPRNRDERTHPYLK